jgi:predicted metal-dependent phosphoesterase TrpH
LIDLHTHTTASDGRRTPAELVDRAAAAGVTVLSVTDHDTVAGCDAAAEACAARNVEFVPGIEITAAQDGADVHVLGYFIDVHAAPLLRFLVRQRERRIERARRIIERLEQEGFALNAEQILQPALEASGRAVGRPWIARALVQNGYVASIEEAFARWLSRGRPAFVPRQAATPAEVLASIHEAGGVASLAHPGLLRRDEWLASFADAGLDAVESYHSEHDAAETRRYLSLADALGLAVSGGSDYHGYDSQGAAAPGAVSLPRPAYDRLKDRRAAAAGLG